MHCKQLVPVDISSFGDWTGSRGASSDLIEVPPKVDTVNKKMILMRFGITTQIVRADIYVKLLKNMSRCSVESEKTSEMDSTWLV